MLYSKPITEVIQSRFSCRSYSAAPIPQDKQRVLRDYMKDLTAGPFGTPVRYELIAAEDQDRKALRGLGTYGFIRGAQGFIAGTVSRSPKYLEEYGYRLEQVLLVAADQQLGTCWLGGTFTKSSFARKLHAVEGERVPAVIATGLIADRRDARQAVTRRHLGADSRLPWGSLFFEGKFDTPLSREKAGDYALPLEMLRLGPSASNKQPWRILRVDQAFHFYIQRTAGYRNILTELAGLEDMQRVDLGIAMCHFELTARELGLPGRWAVQEPVVEKPDDQTEYAVSWVNAEK